MSEAVKGQHLFFEQLTNLSLFFLTSKKRNQRSDSLLPILDAKPIQVIPKYQIFSSTAVAEGVPPIEGFWLNRVLVVVCCGYRFQKGSCKCWGCYQRKPTKSLLHCRFGGCLELKFDSGVRGSVCRATRVYLEGIGPKGFGRLRQGVGFR